MASTAVPAAPTHSIGNAEAADPSQATNLLVDLTALGPMLEEAIRTGNSLDAFLLAAGINQIAEDYLHDSLYAIDQAASVLGRSGSALGRLAGTVARWVGLTTRCLKTRRFTGTRALAWQAHVDRLVGRLADIALADLSAPGTAAGAMAESLDHCRQLQTEIPSLPAGLRQAVIRLPACFHDFDQRPEDVDLLAQRFADGHPSAGPLLVVGVRTSGSYLAPLLASALRARHCRPTASMTIRPGRALLPGERALVRSVIAAGGRVLLIDDPPVTGSSLVAAARELEQIGVTRNTIVVMLGLDDEAGALPAALRPYDAVVLAPSEWNVRTRLSWAEVRPALAELLQDDFDLRSLEQVVLAERPRGHHRALFRATGVDAIDGSQRRMDVLATAVGVGYFGAHHLTVARMLSRFAPRVLGLRSGVLYREWLPSDRAMPYASDDLAPAVAAYVAERRNILRVGRDMSVGLAGQRPVWEVAALILARSFGRAAPLLRVIAVDRLVRRLLTVSRPSVLDGSVTAAHWFEDRDGQPVKVNVSERTNWRLGLASFDAAYDLASVGASSPDGALAARVRAAWLAETGEQVDSERWLLHELAHLWGVAREDPAREAEVRHASARAAARYFADAFLADLEASGRGPLCALDIDGVLETDELGFPAPTRASATALRSLLAHGYRPLLVTGRGVEEVRDRCQAYGLVGGVAEYGSAIWVEGRAVPAGLVSADAAAALDRLRVLLRSREGVRLDTAFSYAVRAYRLGSGGDRRPLGGREVAECLRASGCAGVVRAIPGDSQTDFVAVGVDKGTGLRALTGALEAGDLAPGEPVVSLAVGDTVADAPMLALASAPFVPAHASRAATRTGAKRLGRPYQAGLSQAVGELLGHPPGSCQSCRVPPSTDGRDLLLALLSLAENGPRGLAAGALRLSWRPPR